MKAGGVDEPQEERARRGVSPRTLLPPKGELLLVRNTLPHNIQCHAVALLQRLYRLGQT
jgi:hypothetical protein